MESAASVIKDRRQIICIFDVQTQGGQAHPGVPISIILNNKKDNNRMKLKNKNMIACRNIKNNTTKKNFDKDNLNMTNKIWNSCRNVITVKRVCFTDKLILPIIINTWFLITHSYLDFLTKFTDFSEIRKIFEDGLLNPKCTPTVSEIFLKILLYYQHYRP